METVRSNPLHFQSRPDNMPWDEFEFGQQQVQYAPATTSMHSQQDITHERVWGAPQGAFIHPAEQVLKGSASNVGDSAGMGISSQWRQMGGARRRELLDNDKRRGGTKFSLNSGCSVHRYFQVAQRALEQFHKMYRDGSSLEETYVMGHRMVVFLSDCLPGHPDFWATEVQDLRRHSRHELLELNKCLDDVALRIDEDMCNQFVEESVLPIDLDSDSECEEIADSDWVAFGGWEDESTVWKEGKRNTDSPTSDTVATTGTGSLEAFDISSSDESVQERHADLSDGDEGSPQHIYTVELGTEFLERIAEEAVEYETDSEADDSWAQDDDSCARTASSGRGVTYDPARLAFRDLMNRAPAARLLSPSLQENSSEEEWTQRPDPPAHSFYEDDMENRLEAELLRGRQDKPASESTVLVDTEIQRYLSSSFEEDPKAVFESSMARLKESSPSSTCTVPGRTLSKSVGVSAFREVTQQEVPN